MMLLTQGGPRNVWGGIGPGDIIDFFGGGGTIF